MSYQSLLLLHISIILLWINCKCNAELEQIFNHCCSLGTNIAAQEFKCSDSLSPINGVPAEQQSICLSTIQLCCIQTLRDIDCQEGKQAARNGLNCQESIEEDNKYCCEACKLGMISGSMSMSCNFQTFSFGPPWDTVYETCCLGTEPGTSIDPLVSGDPSIKNVTVDKSVTNSPQENICDLLQGELCAHICIPSPGSYRCACHEGFTLMADGKTCHQEKFVDRCSSQSPCQQICQDNGVSVLCSCYEGYKLNSDNKTCSDINECQEDQHKCGNDQKCVNLPGSYQCTSYQHKTQKKCNSGHRFSEEFGNCIDIDECLENLENPCDSNQACENTVGSYTCHCKSGFQLDSVTQACVDINECQVNLHNCLSSQRCDNTIGSFQCVRFVNCGTGYTLNAETGLCEDNDECALKMCSYLGPDWQCRNTLGSFRCERESKTETSCTGNCVLATVATRPGKMECPRGFFTGNMGRCLDINECEKGANCKPNQRCINTHGGYMCTNILNCEAGFKLSEAKTQCIDIDECTEQDHICEHTCINTWGSFRCICNQGFKLNDDNRTCGDIHECEIFKNRRLCIGYCVNQPGSYSCQCPQGYRLGLDGASCQDIDECSEDNPCTDADSVCLNMRGTYRCNSIACPTDYTRDSQHKNRCKRISMKNCKESDTECLHKPMSYSFHFITLVSNLSIPGGALDLFTMRGPLWASTTVNFKLELTSAQAPPTVTPATREDFLLTNTAHNQCNIRLIQTLLGPQDIHLQLTMELYYNGIYGGTTISKILIFVSQYDF